MMALILFLASLLGFWLAIILILKKENQIAHRLLAALGILVAFSLGLNAFYISGYSNNWPHLIGLDNANPFLIPPLIYLYTRSLSESRFRFKLKDGYHLIPFILYAIYPKPVSCSSQILQRKRMTDRPSIIMITTLCHHYLITTITWTTLPTHSFANSVYYGN